MVDFRIHRPGDSVGVATRDLGSGQRAVGRYVDEKDGDDLTIEMAEDVPLGHKISLVPISKAEEVIEYGVAIGVATADIEAGKHVHVHNLKGQRWA
jgi:(2R)-sulfolactate sulfo-lyase subunit alpha